jgi:hypothetical protein
MTTKIFIFISYLRNERSINARRIIEWKFNIIFILAIFFSLTRFRSTSGRDVLKEIFAFFVHNKSDMSWTLCDMKSAHLIFHLPMKRRKNSFLFEISRKQTCDDFSIICLFRFCRKWNFHLRRIFPSTQYRSPRKIYY